MDSPPAGETKARSLSFVSAAIWTLIALFLDVFLLGMTESAREGAFFDLVSRTGCEALAYAVVLFGVLRLHEPETSIRKVLALRTPSVLAILLAIAIGAALAMPSEWLDQLLDGRFPRGQAEKDAYDRLLSVATIGKRASLLVTLVVFQPALDELFFRGAVFTPLRRTRRVETVIVATAAFETLGSLSPRAMLSLLTATLVFAWIRGTTGSVLPSIAARMAYYGVGIVPMVLGREEPKPTRALLAGSAVLGLLALVALSVLARRDPRLLAARQADADWEG